MNISNPCPFHRQKMAELFLEEIQYSGRLLSKFFTLLFLKTKNYSNNLLLKWKVSSLIKPSHMSSVFTLLHKNVAKCPFIYFLVR